jgi:hypothetical protein
VSTFANPADNSFCAEKEENNKAIFFVIPKKVRIQIKALSCKVKIFHPWYVSCKLKYVNWHKLSDGPPNGKHWPEP